MRARAIVRPLLTFVLVLVVALGLLLYIAFVDAFQSYGEFLLDRVNSSAEIVEHSVETLLQAGLPLPQLVGFDIATDPILASDEAIRDVSIIDNDGVILFQNSEAGYELASLSEFSPRQIFFDGDYLVYESEDALQVRVPLEGRFDQPGTLLVTMARSSISHFVTGYLRLGVVFAIAIVIVYAIVFFALLYKRRVTALVANLAYGIAILALSALVVGSLIQIYSAGVEQKAKALADSLSARLGLIFDVGLGIEDIAGIDEVFIDYKRLNPDIDYISLTQDDVVIVHTDPENLLQPYAPKAGAIEYRQDIYDELGLAISVAIPRSVVLGRLARNIKNFLVLFLASMFLSWLLLRILFSVYPDIHAKLAPSRLSPEASRARGLLDLIFPAFFLVNFLEGLHYSYLPQFFGQLASEAGVAGERVGIVYALYWAMYALVLIPAGRSARTLEGVQRLLTVGFFLVTASMALLALLQQFAWLYLLRAIAGVGQGMVFIAVQAYILQQSDERQRTEAVSIIVYGYNGGVISGTVIGALLVSSLGVSRLLLISAAIAFCMIWYSVVVIGRAQRSKGAGAAAVPSGEDDAAVPRDKDGIAAPSGRGAAIAAPSGKDDAAVQRALDADPAAAVHNIGRDLSLRQGFWRKCKMLFADREFAKTILLVGLITKAVLAGVVFLALPHFLSTLDYRQEDIGQILMFYTLGVLLVSRFVARYADRIGNTRHILVFGTMGSALGLAIIASAHLVAHSLVSQTLVLIGGILVLGLAHGFIHAPIVTHITRSPVSGVLGKTLTASVYRFMERIGHVLGPLVFGYFLLQASASINSIYYIASIVAVFGLLFYLIPSARRARQTPTTLTDQTK